MKLVRFFITAAVLLGTTTAAYAQKQPSTNAISQLEWLAGCWEGTVAGRVFEEMWMAPRAGMMLGVSRTINDGKVVEYEGMRIYERGDSLVFAASPSGQLPTEFTSPGATLKSVTFSNPAHDFPQRVIYTSGENGAVNARIEGTVNGRERGVDFRLQPVKCGT